MKRAELTRRLRGALLVEPQLAVRAREGLGCAIGDLDLSSEERHLARGEGGHAQESVDFEAIADELIVEIEEGMPS